MGYVKGDFPCQEDFRVGQITDQWSKLVKQDKGKRDRSERANEMKKGRRGRRDRKGVAEKCGRAYGRTGWMIYVDVKVSR